MKLSLRYWRTVVCLTQVLLLLVSGALATGCGRGTPSAKAKRAKTPDSQAEATPREGLRILAYKGYLGEQVVKDAAEAGMVKIDVDTFTTDEEFETKWKDGTGDYDLVLPSYPQLTQILSNELAVVLDKKKLPHLKHVDPKLLGGIHELDKENKYTVPVVFIPLVVLGVRTDHVKEPIKSLDVLFDEKYRDKIGIVDSPKMMLATFLMYKGHAPVVGDDSPDKVKDVLGKLRPAIKEFSSASLADKLKKGDVWLALDLFGNLDAPQGSDEKNIRLLVPDTGVPIYVESLCVAKDSPHPDLAFWFINYLLDEEVSLQNTIETGQATVNLAARARVEAKTREDTVAYPPAPAKAKVLLDWMYQEKEENKKIEPFWKEYKSSK